MQEIIYKETINYIYRSRVKATVVMHSFPSVKLLIKNLIRGKALENEIKEKKKKKKKKKTQKNNNKKKKKKKTNKKYWLVKLVLVAQYIPLKNA